jgi:hypothetical protein
MEVVESGRVRVGEAELVQQRSMEAEAAAAQTIATDVVCNVNGKAT